MTVSTTLSYLVGLTAVFLGLCSTGIPKRLGFYKRFYELLAGDPMIGMFPCTVPTERDWGFTLEELYNGTTTRSDNDNDGGGGGAALYEETKHALRTRLRGQTALVTGANSGTGYQISLALARMGVSVTMACRNEQKCDAAARAIREDDAVERESSSSVVIKTMIVDTSSLKSVRDFCRKFLLESDDGNGNPLPLDMLFLNAGIGASPPNDDGSLRLTSEGIEKIFATNVVGHHLVYKLLEPVIRRSDSLRKVPPRIVLTSSSASYNVEYPYRVATDLKTLNSVPGGDHNLYGQSKLAQILWARELTSRIDSEPKLNDDSRKTNPNEIVYVNAGHPGAVDTGIWDKIEFEQFPYGTLIKRFLEFAVRPYMWTAEEGALTLLFLGTAFETLRRHNIRGKYYHPQSIEMKNHELAPYDDESTKRLQKRLWDFLDELVAEYS